jgi:hypothetical protein
MLSGNRCIICGWQKINYKGNLLVEGAHVRKYAGTPDYDKSDNVIGLCPNHHTEFDAGNFFIDPINKMAIFRDKSDPYHGKKLVGGINHIKSGYFDYHRVHCYKEVKR